MIHHQIEFYSNEEGLNHRRIAFAFPDTLALVKSKDLVNYVATPHVNFTNSAVNIYEAEYSNAQFAIALDGAAPVFQTLPPAPYFGTSQLNKVFKNYQQSLGWGKYNAITNLYEYPIEFDVDDIIGRFVVLSDPTNFPVAFPAVTSVDLYLFTDLTLTSGLGLMMGATQQSYINATTVKQVYTLPNDPKLLDLVSNGVSVRLYDGIEVRTFAGLRGTTQINKFTNSLCTVPISDTPVYDQVIYPKHGEALIPIPFNAGDIRNLEIRFYSALDSSKELFFTQGDAFVRLSITQQRIR